MAKLVLNCRPNGRRRLGRPLKGILDEVETGLSGPNWWRMMMMMMMVMFSLLLYVCNILSSTLWSSKGFLPLRQITGIVWFGYICLYFCVLGHSQTCEERLLVPSCLSVRKQVTSETVCWVRVYRVCRAE